MDEADDYTPKVDGRLQGCLPTQHGPAGGQRLAVLVWTAPATGTYRLTPDKAIYGGKTLLARFRFIVTVT